MHNLTDLSNQAENELNQTPDAGALEAWRVKWLSRKGLVQQAVDQLGVLPREQRAEDRKSVV